MVFCFIAGSYNKPHTLPTPSYDCTENGTHTLTTLQPRAMTEQQQQQGMEWLAGVLAPEYLIGDSQGEGTSMELRLLSCGRGGWCAAMWASRAMEAHCFTSMSLGFTARGLQTWHAPWSCRWVGSTGAMSPDIL